MTELEVIAVLRAAVLQLNKALELAAENAVEVTPQFQDGTSMEHGAPLLILSIELTKHLGTV